MNAKLLSLAAAGILATVAVSAAVADPAERITNSGEGRVGDHATDELRDPTTFVTTTRAVGDVAQKARATFGDNSVRSATTVYGDSWVYDATTDLFFDRDGDGYFHRLRVRFDADTLFTAMWVYAEIYLSADGKAWEHLYTTQDFVVRGIDPLDDYEVETDLVGGYSTALYDVLIELYDAETGLLVDEFGPRESPAFSLRPLEDMSRDGVSTLPPVQSGGGAFGWLSLPGLLAAWFCRRRRGSGAASAA